MTLQLGGSDRGRPHLEAVPFESLRDFESDDHLEAWRAFSRSCRAVAEPSTVLRPAVSADGALRKLVESLSGAAAPRTAEKARELFQSRFRPFRILGSGEDARRESGFLTGYYEPVVEGSRVRTADFTEPVLRRPDDLVLSSPGETSVAHHPELGAARRRVGDRLEPYPHRAAIEAGALAGHSEPLVWLRDGVEVFIVQVQGSAKVRLTDGPLLRLTYAGRNGWPYRSIGKILLEEGHIPASDMSLANLKGWIRAHGQKSGEPGRALMQKNRSYVFFTASSCPQDEGPIGGAGVPLTALRSIAVDRHIWAYGLPFWIDAEIPWQAASASPFRRLMIAQDTGSAILGAGRADVFFGSGARAGKRAGDIRHPASMTVLLPKAWEGAK